VTAIWREDTAGGEPASPAVPPPFAAALRSLVAEVDGGSMGPANAHERRLVQRVRAALAAFEAGWTVLGDPELGDPELGDPELGHLAGRSGSG
jgi:hypothetical protein